MTHMFRLRDLQLYCHAIINGDPLYTVQRISVLYIEKAMLHIIPIEEKQEEQI